MNKEMCSGTYRAEQFPDRVVIYATGDHETTGYRVSFERIGVTVFPPQFSFMHEMAAGVRVSSRTPFEEQISFRTERKVESVVIYDVRGRHEVEVVQKTEANESPRRVNT